MKLTVLGGGDEIGASCYLLTQNNKGFVIDAGMRLHAERMFPLFIKAMEILNHWTDIKVIFITHGHLDHIGGLLSLFEKNQNVLIYTAVGNKDIIRTQLDSIYNRKENELDIELSHEYATDLIAKCMQNVIEFPFFKLKKIPFTNIYFEFWPAGHIIGSASIFIKTPEGNILFSGDICKFNRYSVPNLKYGQYPIDYFISESTYLGSDNIRTPQEDFKILYERIIQIIKNRGIAFIPSFAIGKAQEILKMILIENKKNNYRIPIFLDGLVVKITDIYLNHYQNSFLTQDEYQMLHQCKIEKRADSYLTFAEAKRGSIVIASSGMLIKKSRSAFWADALIEDSRSGIFFSGYMDEESPGSALLKRKVGESYKSQNGKECKIQCNLYSHHIGTHISSDDLAELIYTINPKKIFLIHGNHTPNSIMSFRRKLENKFQRIVDFENLSNLQQISLGESNE